MIGIINYGLGNVSAFGNIYKKLGVDYKYIVQKKDLEGVKKLILPGVGAFDYAMKCFNDSGLREDIDHLVIEKKIPVLGVCVGLQIMGHSSSEGVSTGLAWLNGHVIKFDQNTLPAGYPLPHMGWNSLNIQKEDPILEGLKNSKFYYLHSYYFEGKNSTDIIGTCSYGDEFCCVVKKDNIYGMQCHPEKSHSYGVKFLNNFSKL
jgi:imidazole glycerol-phosphate synthase subunit HisH